MYLKSMTLSADLAQRVEPVVDLGLAGGADLVVRALDLEAERVELRATIWSRRSA